MQPQKSDRHGIFALVTRALQRARIAILTVALTYLVSVSVGILMVHTGNKWALTYRDHIVPEAQRAGYRPLRKEQRVRPSGRAFKGEL